MMRLVCRVCNMGLLQLMRDGMLLALLLGPFLMGAASWSLLPLASKAIRAQWSLSIAPWYPLADAFVILMTSFMVSIAGAFVVLEELDERISQYYSVTPVAGTRYDAARLAAPMIWAFSCSIAVKALFGLSRYTMLQTLAVSVLACGNGFAVAALVATLSRNKVEGFALPKLAGISILGLPAAWFVRGPYQYLAAFLPSFWVGKLAAKPQAFDMVLGMVTCAAWIVVSVRMLHKRMSCQAIRA